MTVSRIERGRVEDMKVATVLRVAEVLGIRVEWLARWRGAELDRMLNARHASMHEAVVPWLESAGWMVAPEVSFSIYGERGIIDIVAWDPSTRALLIVELKSALVDVQALIGTVDRYARLGPRVAADRGWQVDSVSAWVLLAEGRTNRRRVTAHARVLRSAFPADGRQMHAWLRKPSGGLRGLSFVPDRLSGTVRLATGGSDRVRVARTSVTRMPDVAKPSRSDELADSWPGKRA